MKPLIDLDLYSSEQDQFRGIAYSPLQPNQHYGRMRISTFNFTVPTGNIDVSTYTNSKARIGLALLPKGARLIDIRFKFGAMGTSAKMHLGLFGADDSGYISADNSTLADDDDKLMSAVDVAAAGVGTWSVDVVTVTLAPLYELEKQCYLVATAYNADWTAAIVLMGHVGYVVD